MKDEKSTEACKIDVKKRKIGRSSANVRLKKREDKKARAMSARKMLVLLADLTHLTDASRPIAWALP